MSFIDCHVHLYPPEVNRAPDAWALASGERHWAELCVRVRKNGRAVQGFPDVDELLRAMDAAGVARAVLLGWYWEKHDTCVRQNQFYATCVKSHPDRLAAFATVHPASGPAAVKEEIVRASEAGFSGVGELSPHSQGFLIHDPGWQEILGFAGECGLAVNLHVSDSAGKRYPGKVNTPLEDFLDMARRYPRTTFILAHWGARIPFHEQWGTEIRALQNVYYDTAASPLLYDSRVFSEMLSLVPERVLFGSDYPLVLYPNREITPAINSFIAEVQALGLSTEQEAAVLGGNARRLFRWAKQ